MDLVKYINSIGARSKNAERVLSTADTDIKNAALYFSAKEMDKRRDEILLANKKDMETARGNNITDAFMDRLMLNDKRIDEMIKGLREVAALNDPIGQVTEMFKRPNGLMIGKMKTPIGVIGIIYEARPNVTVDAAALCLKSGNSVILRGGSEAINSNKALSLILRDGANMAGLPSDCIQLVEETDREAALYMMRLNDYIDVLIPRGGAGLIQNVVKNATVPVIKTGEGNCHIFVDESADLTMAENIIINAKVQRPAVCNSVETILIHKNIAANFIPKICSSLMDNGVEIRGCIETCKYFKDANPATEEDWKTEYSNLIIAVKVVKDMEEAIDHIYKYSTKHSESIITNNYENSQKFLKVVDSAAVYVNASTRFTDGGQFGFGAEIGISTQKLHARGPMGLNELTTTKYVIYGNGQIRP